MAIFILIFWEDFDLGRNHVHCTHLTARHGIIAHRLWEENLVFGGDDPLGLLPKLFGKDFSRQNGPGKSLPKSSDNDPKGIINKDLSYVSQILLSKTTGNDPMSYC